MPASARKIRLVVCSRGGSRKHNSSVFQLRVCEIEFLKGLFPPPPSPPASHILAETDKLRQPFLYLLPTRQSAVLTLLVYGGNVAFKFQGKRIRFFFGLCCSLRWRLWRPASASAAPPPDWCRSWKVLGGSDGSLT